MTPEQRAKNLIDACMVGLGDYPDKYTYLPQITKAIREAEREAKKQERERCAEVAWNYGRGYKSLEITAAEIAAKIREDES